MSSREKVTIRRVSHAVLRGHGREDSPVYFFCQPGGSRTLDLISSSPFNHGEMQHDLPQRFAALGLKANISRLPAIMHREVLRTETGPVDLTRFYYRADIQVDNMPEGNAGQIVGLTAFQVACLSTERLRREAVRWVVMADAGLKLPQSADQLRMLEPGDNLPGVESGAARVRGHRMLIIYACHDPALQRYLSNPLNDVVVNGKRIHYRAPVNPGSAFKDLSKTPTSPPNDLLTGPSTTWI